MVALSDCQRLQDAEMAYHKLMVGAREVTVHVEGFGAVTYQQANSAELKTYIDSLKAQLALKERRPRRGLLLMRF